jgi:hypothetical protein
MQAARGVVYLQWQGLERALCEVYSIQENGGRRQVSFDNHRLSGLAVHQAPVCVCVCVCVCSLMYVTVRLYRIHAHVTHKFACMAMPCAVAVKPEEKRYMLHTSLFRTQKLTTSLYEGASKTTAYRRSHTHTHTHTETHTRSLTCPYCSLIRCTHLRYCAQSQGGSLRANPPDCVLIRADESA